MKFNALPEKVKQAALTDPDAIHDYEFLRGKGWSEADATEAVRSEPTKDSDASATTQPASNSTPGAAGEQPDGGKIPEAHRSADSDPMKDPFVRLFGKPESLEEMMQRLMGCARGVQQ